jgi:hypothetical protein
VCGPTDLALIELCQPNNDNPINELIAKSIVNATATGERDPTLIKERAMRALGVRRPTAETSALGQKRTFCDASAMSALPLKADFC